MSKVSSNSYYHFRCVWPDMPKLPEITSLLSMKACCKWILWWGWSSIPKVSIIAILECLHNISKKNLGMKLIFFLRQNFLQVDFNILHIKVSTRWYCHYCWSWSSILKILKVTRFEYLYSISKKKLRVEFIFSMQINIKVSISWHYYFWWKRPDMMYKAHKIRSW